MKKKKIAVFANTWNSDMVAPFIKGFSLKLPKGSADTFIFLAANSYGRSQNSNASEVSIHSLPDLTDFDAAVVFSQGLNSNETRKKIYDNCEKAGITTVCIGDRHPVFNSIIVENDKAMRALCEHVYNEHGVRKVAFFAGPQENEDSNIRLNAVKNFMEEKGLPLREGDIFYTNWEVSRCMDLISTNFKDKESLPDIAVFANDSLAMAGIMAFENMGFKCPEDILVTGYDYTNSGRTYYPSIASIDQRYDLMGEICAQMLTDVFEGKTIEREQSIEAEFVPGESCGCLEYRKDDEQRKVFCHSIIGKQYEETNRSGLIYGIRMAFQESSRFSTLPSKLQNALYNTDNAEADTIYILLDPTLERIGTEEPENLPKFKYADKMQVVAAKKNGVPIKANMIKKCEIIPKYSPEGENEILFVMPLYIESFVVGFFVMGKNESGLRDWIYEEFQSCMVQSLNYYKTNIRLTALNDKLSELMQTDALTSLKNRTAYENAKAGLRNHYLAQDDLRFAAVMFDLNDLKKINDELGHGAGDIYIKNSSELICRTFKHSPVFRIGGDEFVAIVKNSDYDERYELLKKFRNEVDRLRKENVPAMKRVSVASGMADYDEIVNEDIETLFKLADERMYENKRLMKAGVI